MRNNCSKENTLPSAPCARGSEGPVPVRRASRGGPPNASSLKSGRGEVPLKAISIRARQLLDIEAVRCQVLGEGDESHFRLLPVCFLQDQREPVLTAICVIIKRHITQHYIVHTH